MSDYLMNSDLTPKQQTSEALRQAETILITTAQRPNVDQVAAVIALAAILRKFGKRVSAVISDPIPAAARFLPTREIESKLSGLRDFVINLDTAQAEVESLRYEVLDNKLSVFITPFKGEFKPQDVSFAHGDFHFDLAVVVGVGSRSRIDRIYAENQALFASIPVVNIDYRRSNENFGAINLIDPYASSLCEILFALSESLQSGMIDADIATVMLAGLMASTEQFTAAHTSPKSLTMAAQFMAAGARQQEVVKGLHGGGERGGGQRPEGGERPPRREQRPAQPERPAQPSPAHVSAAPSAEPIAEVVPEPVVLELPVAAAPADETVSEPVHEPAPQHVPQPASAGEQAVAADFTAAAEILRQRHVYEPDQN